MSPETETNLALLMNAYQWLRANGDTPCAPTPEALSALSHELGCPVSKSTIQRVEQTALEKARHAARQLGREYFLSAEP